MKRTFTLLFPLFFVGAFTAHAGTPVIDGILDPAEGWGTPVGTGDGIAGWSDANAKAFYITSDANYVYFGAEVNAADWQQYIIVVNSKPGGNTSDPWGRTITYAQPNAPDFLFRGDIAKSNYSQFQVWDGAAWTGTSTNVNENGQEVKSTFSGTNGFIEVRVPKATIGTDMIDAQFIICGNNDGTENGHGCFDAIPNDNNCTGWNAPNNASIVTKYVTDVLLPVNFLSFSGTLKGNIVSLVWETADETGTNAYEVEQSENARVWKIAGRIPSSNRAGNNTYHYQVQNLASDLNYYRIKLINKNGSTQYSKTISFNINAPLGVALINNPVNNGSLRLSVNLPKQLALQVSLIGVNGKMTNTRQFRHQGGSSFMQIETANLPKGMYVLKVTSENGTQTFKVMIQ